MNKDFKVIEKSFIASIAQKVLKTDSMAITIGNRIYLNGVSKETFLGNKPWLYHELEHIKQFKQYGFFKFLYLYLLESIKKGYYLNKFEVEARNAAMEHLKNTSNISS